MVGLNLYISIENTKKYQLSYKTISNIDNFGENTIYDLFGGAFGVYKSPKCILQFFVKFNYNFLDQVL